MRYAIIGLGFISKRHIDAIGRTGGELLMACDIDRGKFGHGVHCTSHYEFMSALPRWKDVDTVVVCTPNNLHVEMSRWAERHGKRVLCEKPFALSDDLDGFEDTFIVMQLRHHPILKALRAKELSEIEDVHLYVRVKRDRSYWEGWKGDENRSGGILFNLGVHYLDALLQLFGDQYEVVESDIEEASAYCVVRFRTLRNPVRINISITDTDEGQDRFLMVNGEKYRFSDKDNLSFEDLHVKVYEDMLKGKGVRPQDIRPLTRFIQGLKAYGVPSVPPV